MAYANSDELQLYFNRIRPIYFELFNLAHAVTGASAQAEYCLQYALLECWSLGSAPSSRHGFREALRSATLHAALKHPGSAEPEDDWDGLRAADAASDPIAQLIAQEPRQLRRLLALRYGCALSLRKSARLASLEPRRARQLLERFEARVRRTLPAADRRRFEMRIQRSVRVGMAQPNPRAPELDSLLRTFQMDAASVAQSSRLPGRILRTIVAAVLMLACMLVFWLAAVLIQPAVLEAPDAQTTVEAAPSEEASPE